MTDQQAWREQPSRGIKPIALYLPQYHPIAENNEWWGPGFTEWTNAARARPLFRGHYQPHVPADLGFYDLRLEETRIAQADLARRYGLHGFCYYHYWFGNGRRLLERPFNEVLASGKPDFPFCLAWANQTWAGVWHGLKNRVLVEQTYPGPQDHEMHFEALLPAFRDPRYIRVDSRPLFVVYNPEGLPDSLKTLAQWRRMALDAGLDGLFLVAEHVNPDWPFASLGYDAHIHVPLLPKRREWIPWSQPVRKVYNKLLDLANYPSVVDYRSRLEYFVPEVSAPQSRFPCVIPNWDNTPRSGAQGLVLHGSTPELFRAQVRRAVQRLEGNPAEHKLLFIKSWNEWAEGNHLEPDLKFGHGYLQALRAEL